MRPYGESTTASLGRCSELCRIKIQIEYNKKHPPQQTFISVLKEASSCSRIIGRKNATAIQDGHTIQEEEREKRSIPIHILTIPAYVKRP